MRHTIHTPTEQFGYVETEFDQTTLAGDAYSLHTTLVEIAKPSTGMDSKDFNQILDEYLANGNIVGDPGVFQRMSVEQVAIIQAIKRSRARTK